MYALNGTDPGLASAGSPFDDSAAHVASNGGATPATICGGTSDTLPRMSAGNASARTSSSSPLGSSPGTGNNPAAIMAAFTAFVQQMFGQIASWMQHPTLLGTSAPPAPRNLQSQGSGGLPPTGP